MTDTPDLRRPRVVRQNDRVVIEVAPDDAEELRIHLNSHNIRTADLPAAPGVARLHVLDLPADEVDAVLGEWEVPTA
jgi:hypothetical protein